MHVIARLLPLLCLALAQQDTERGLPHASPCPAVYSYGWEPSGGWHGIITIIPPARYSEAQLVLRMTVPYYRPDAGVGRVEIKGGTAEIQAISRRAYRGERKQIQFMIIFPPFNDVPRVKEIFINGKSFCAANQVYADTRSTIELKYTLRTGLNMPLANGNEFSIAGTPPSRPDLVTVAILQPMDEARPMVSSPQSPSRPSAPSSQGPSRPLAPPNVPGSKPPCKCNKTTDAQADDNNYPMHLRPANHVFHAFKPPSPGVGGGNNHVQEANDFSTSTPASVYRPRPIVPVSSGNGNAGGNNYYTTSTPANVFRPRPVVPVSGGNGNAGGNNYATSTPTFVNRPRPVVPGGNNNYATSTPTSVNRPRPVVSGGNGIYTKPSRPAMVSHKNDEVDDKIYFIMTDSDDVNSPRIIKLLEHLLIISKKHYRIDLERLEIEKKRLALENKPHYTFVI